MSLTPFDADFGTYQGRIKPTGWTPAAGAWVYVLGHDLPNVVRTFQMGDEHAVAQTADLTGFTFMRPTIHVRPPTIAAAVAWTLSAEIDGAELWSYPIPIGSRTRTFRDVALIVSQIGGLAPVTFRLAVNGAPGAFVEAELPGVYLDQVAADTSLAPALVVCRDPEPAETNVPPDTSISFMVADQALRDISRINVFVNEVGVASGDGTVMLVLAAGWGVTVTPLMTGVSRVDLDPPPGLFASLDVVQMHVVVGVAGGVDTETFWNFTIADVEGPRLAKAIAMREKEIRVTFDELVVMSSASAANDALNPANYAITLLAGKPAVLPSVVAVEAFSPTVVTLRLDKIMTRLATYQLTVSSVEDLFANPIAPPYDHLPFEGYECDAPKGRSMTLYGLMPEQDRIDDETRDLWFICAILQEIIDILFCLADRFLDIINVDLAEEPWLDAMLRDLGNPFLFTLTTNQKRRLILSLVVLYKMKGTGPGIVAAIRLLLGLEVWINVFAWAPAPLGDVVMGETFILGSDNLDDVYAFEVIFNVILTDEQRDRAHQIIEVMKAAHERHIIVEPPPPPVDHDHWELGFSKLGVETILHP